MKVFIGYSTALLYWMRRGRTAVDAARQVRIDSISDAAHTSSDLKSIRLESYGIEASKSRGWPSRTRDIKAAAKGDACGNGPAPEGEAFHVLVPEGSSRNRTDGFVRHRWTSPIPQNGFVALAPGVLMSSPEFAFVQMAGVLSMTQLVLVGYWLCACYRVGERGDLEATVPLTSVERLRSFADGASGCYGAKKARRALAWVAEGARSPMEVHTCMLASLPLHMGGYGLGLPSINHRIDAREFDAQTLDRPDRSYFEVDLYWVRQRVGVEYEGEEHYERDRIRKDKRRLNCLTCNGERILTVTYDQLSDYESRQVLMNQLAKLMGKQLSVPTARDQMARTSLTDLLFGRGFSL